MDTTSAPGPHPRAAAEHPRLGAGPGQGQARAGAQQPAGLAPEAAVQDGPDRAPGLQRHAAVLHSLKGQLSQHNIQKKKLLVRDSFLQAKIHTTLMIMGGFKEVCLTICFGEVDALSVFCQFC